MRVTSAITAAMLALAMTSAAMAQSGSASFPDRPIKMVVPFGAGGAGDIAARLVVDEMRKALKVPIVIENRPGGNGLVGAAALAKASPDGYTIGFSGHTVHAGGHAAFKTMPFHPVDDFAPIALAFKAPLVLSVKNENPAKTEAELRTWIQTHPQTASYSYHNGGSQIATNLYLKRIQGKALAVPYLSPVAAMTDLAGGIFAFGFYEPTPVKPLLDSHRLRPLAVTSRVRLPMLPEVPTLREAGLPDFDLQSWMGFFAPAGTPQPVIKILSEAVKSALDKPSVQEKAHALGMTVEDLQNEKFRDFIEAEAKLWKIRYQEAGIEPL